jgi:hypothetical protein
MRIVLEEGDDRRTLLALAKALKRAARGVPVDAEWGVNKGTNKFARHIGVSRQTVLRALDGGDGGERIREQWAEWQEQRNANKEG